MGLRCDQEEPRHDRPPRVGFLGLVCLIAIAWVSVRTSRGAVAFEMIAASGGYRLTIRQPGTKSEGSGRDRPLSV